ncbi:MULTISPECIES: hypothetical protein [Bacillus cereus group]|nr:MULTISPECIES: hypothetical protein [Bacillus cereus group]HDR7888520.1 hypothetical protein [Bacillus toyonensis]
MSEKDYQRIDLNLDEITAEKDLVRIYLEKTKEGIVLSSVGAAHSLKEK